MFKLSFCSAARSPTLCLFPRRQILKPRLLSYSMTSSDWTSVTKEGCPPYLAFQKPIQKSQQDDRDYRLIRLENGLHAMLVHDAKADKAAASLDVAVGHLSDPVSHQIAGNLGRCLSTSVTVRHRLIRIDVLFGLNAFMIAAFGFRRQTDKPLPDRMICPVWPTSASIYYLWCDISLVPYLRGINALLQGTEKFPRENEYSEVGSALLVTYRCGSNADYPKFLAKNSGSSNAYTSTTNTNFYFSVATPALPPALARFAAFFHSPLFSPSCTSRELNAVDSEHKKNIQTDVWRIYQVNKHLSREGHVWRKFGSGNRESLSQAARLLKEKDKLNGSLLRNSLKPNSAAPSPIPSRTPSPSPSVASHVSDSESDGGFVGRETRRRLVEWWNEEYCASRMRLCVVGKGK